MREQDYENKKLLITKFTFFFCKRSTQIFVLVRIVPWRCQQITKIWRNFWLSKQICSECDLCKFKHVLQIRFSVVVAVVVVF